jgi:hypothetical protein
MRQSAIDIRNQDNTRKTKTHFRRIMMNHRMGQRIATDQPVSLFSTERGWLAGELVNISLTGAAVRCEDWQALEPCMPVEVLLEPDDGKLPEQVKLHGFVVRLQEGTVGLMFMRDIVELVHRMRPTALAGGKHGFNASQAGIG